MHTRTTSPVWYDLPTIAEYSDDEKILGDVDELAAMTFEPAKSLTLPLT